MQLTLNGEASEFATARNIADLVRSLGLDSRKVAVERNLGIVPRSLWPSTLLSDGDRIEIVHFVGGG